MSAGETRRKLRTVTIALKLRRVTIKRKVVGAREKLEYD